MICSIGPSGVASVEGAISSASGAGAAMSLSSCTVGSRKYFCARSWSRSPAAGISLARENRELLMKEVLMLSEVAMPRKARPKAAVSMYPENARSATAARDSCFNDLSPDWPGATGRQAARITHLPPGRITRPATVSSWCVTATRAPAAASAPAIACPIPCRAPVTTATSPASGASCPGTSAWPSRRRRRRSDR